jgi:hypothetical protein
MVLPWQQIFIVIDYVDINILDYGHGWEVEVG